MKMYLYVSGTTGGGVTRLILVRVGESTAEHLTGRYSLSLCLSLTAAIGVPQSDTKLTATNEGTNGLPIV